MDPRGNASKKDESPGKLSINARKRRATQGNVRPYHFQSRLGTRCLMRKYADNNLGVDLEPCLPQFDAAAFKRPRGLDLQI